MAQPDASSFSPENHAATRPPSGSCSRVDAWLLLYGGIMKAANVPSGCTRTLPSKAGAGAGAGVGGGGAGGWQPLTADGSQPEMV
jgi:hypothetical protein